MNIYEKIVIIDPNIDDTAAAETVGKIKDIITNKGGEILKTENWGRRRLAYILNKHQKGNYILILFKSPPTTIMDLERFCKVTDSVIKFMVVKLTKKKQIESVLSSIKEAEKKKQTETAEADTEGVKLKEENLSTSEEKESV
jgi:small subunit ribosomal protein S6